MVALYLDGVPITYSAPDPDLRLADVERVEVMRGPQGTLYGGGSLGGVLRIATRKPDLDRYEASVLAGLSCISGGGGGDELEGMANIPCCRAELALRVVAYSDSQDGYIANPTLGLKRVNDAQRDGLRANLRAALSPHWTASLGVTTQWINNADTQYGLRRLGPYLRDNPVREPHDNDFEHVSLTLAGDGPWGRTTGSVARLSHHFSSRYDATTASTLYGLAGAPAALDEEKAIDLTVAEVTYSTPSDHRLHGLIGAFASTGDIRLDTTLHAALAAGPNAYAERRRDKINETAVYGEVTFDVTKRLSATAGLRWFDFRFDTDSRVTQAAGQRAFSGADDATGLSPKILLSYDARPGLLFYAQAAEGYRPGGYNTAGRIGRDLRRPRLTGPPLPGRRAVELRGRGQAARLGRPPAGPGRRLLRGLGVDAERPVPGRRHGLHGQYRKRRQPGRRSRGRVAPERQDRPAGGRPAERSGDHPAKPRLQFAPRCQPAWCAAGLGQFRRRLSSPPVRRQDPAAARPGDLMSDRRT